MNVPVNRIVWSDATASAALLVMLSAWAAVLLALLSLLDPEPPGGTTLLLAVAGGGAGATVAAVALIGVRVRRLRGLLTGGHAAGGCVEATGATARPGPFGGRLRFRYEVGGRVYERTLRVRNATLMELKAGDTVTVLYDPARPARAVVAELYGRR